MKRRYIVLSLSLVLALALAVPALGGPGNPVASMSASVKQIATKALKRAKAAQTTANTALSTANNAQSDAAKAQSTANNAQKAAGTAQTAANTAQATANGAKKAAEDAQAAANAAQATANSKLGETFSEFGSFDGPNTTSGVAIAECPGESEVTGGGYETSGEGSDEIVPFYTASYGDAWLAGLNRIPGGTQTWSVRAIVTCAA
jgi:membrane protein involved in colicin uptake